MAKLNKTLQTAKCEKDVENIYRQELSVTISDSNITSPFKVDGLLTSKLTNIRTLLEFKYEENMKTKLSQCNILTQCLYYIKKFEDAGEKIPTTIFVGDKNECFALHTNAIVKYLSHEIDWKIAPSEAHKSNFELVSAMVNDTDILPFVFDIDENFSIHQAIDKIKDLSQNVVRKVRITKHNIITIFDYFSKNLIDPVSVKLKTNELANLFIQIVINPTDNFLHPKKKNTLTTKSYGDLSIKENLFKSFFRHFEGDIYSPKEKEILTSLVDRLVEDSTRRNKGEFYTPTAFVDKAVEYISKEFGDDWKEKFVVWDCACGTGNLTRDLKFKELYQSTLEQSDLDTIEQMGYNQGSTKFQFDFLNDSYEHLPEGLLNAIKSGREILFFINPPYATATNMGTGSDHKAGCAKNMINDRMLSEGWGKSSSNLYAQFLYRITELQKTNKNIKIAMFTPTLFLTGGSYSKFREKFLGQFEYKNGFQFCANHFSDTADSWAIGLTIWNGLK